MSLEFPPVEIDAANTWLKDLNDTTTGYVGNTANQTIASYKTVVENASYGNGAYKAWTTDIWQDYSNSTSYGANEWPASGAFDKTEGTQQNSHTGRTYSDASDKSPAGELAIEMPDRIKLTSYSIKNRPGFQATEAPRKWILSGRNCDGDSWTAIETKSVTSWTSGETKTFNVSPGAYYSDYKISWLRTMAYGYHISIYTIKFYGVPFHISRSGPIRFSELGNLPLPGFQSIFSNAKKEIKFSQIKEALKDMPDHSPGTESLAVLRDPTMYCGKIYIPANSYATINFPTEFANTPGVFITHQWKDLGGNWPQNGYYDQNPSTELLTPVRIRTVSTTSFNVYNSDTTMDPVLHWMAVKVGSGTIYGANYVCNLWYTGDNWTSSHLDVYGNHINTQPPGMRLCNQQTENNGLTLWGRIHPVTPTVTRTETQWYIDKVGYTPITTTFQLSASEIFAFLTVKFTTYVTTNQTPFRQKMYHQPSTYGVSDSQKAMYFHRTSQYNYLNGPDGIFQLFNPVIMCSIETGGDDSCQIYLRRNTSERCEYVLRETPGLDGPHVNPPYHTLPTFHSAWQGFSDFGSKPLWHLDANYINANQNVSSSSEIIRWGNSSSKAFKYAIGQSALYPYTTRPTLENDSDGYYVYFDRSQKHYFRIPEPIKWVFLDDDKDNLSYPERMIGTGGITAFCVFKFKDSDLPYWQAWPCFFRCSIIDSHNNLSWGKGAWGEMDIRFAFGFRNSTINWVHSCTFKTSNGHITDGWHIYALRINNNKQEWNSNTSHRSEATAFLYVDGMRMIADRNTSPDTIGDMTTTDNFIGKPYSGDYLSGYMREQIVFNDILPYEKIDSINMHLGKKWNIPTWTLLFRQTYGYWWTSSQSLSLNSDDIMSPNYSILDKIDDYKNTDGKYRLRYVDTGDSSNAGKFNDWRQTSNFTTTTDSVSGYEAVSVYDTGESWGGLSKSSGSFARFDGSPGSSNWSFAVASIFSTWDGGRIRGLQSTNQMEVYIMKEN